MHPLFARAARAYESRGELFHLSLDATYRCDLRCKHCYVGASKRGLRVSDELFFSALRDARELSGVTLLLSGGEFFLFRRWQELLELARELGFFTTIYSHGGLIDAEVARTLRQNLVVDVGVSLYSMTPAVHDAITGRPGSNSQTLAGIEQLLKAGVHVTVKTSILDEMDVADVMSIKSWIAEQGDGQQISHGIGTSITACNDGDTSPCAFDPSAKKVAEVLTALELTGTRPEDDLTTARRLAEPPCRAGTSSVYVNPAGEVWPCVELPEALGDLTRESLKTVWQRVQERRQSDGDVLLRDFSGCSGCAYLAKCSPCMGIARQETGTKTGVPVASCQAAYARELATQPGTEAPLPRGLKSS